MDYKSFVALTNVQVPRVRKERLWAQARARLRTRTQNYLGPALACPEAEHSVPPRFDFLGEVELIVYHPTSIAGRCCLLSCVSHLSRAI